jgi:hypothetical protein
VPVADHRDDATELVAVDDDPELIPSVELVPVPAD